MNRAVTERLQSLPPAVNKVKESVTEYWKKKREEKKVDDFVNANIASEQRKAQEQLDKESRREFALARARAEGENILPAAKRIALTNVRRSSYIVHDINNKISTLKTASAISGSVGAALLTTGMASQGYLENVGISPSAAATLVERTDNLLMWAGFEAANSLQTLSYIAGLKEPNFVQSGLYQASQLLEGVVHLGEKVPALGEQTGPVFLILGTLAIVWGLKERIQARELIATRNRAQEHSTAVMAGIAH